MRIGLKYSVDGKKTLYVIVNQEKIKTEVVTAQGVKLNPETARSVDMSISDIVANVNTKSKDILRYIPDGLLNEEQKKSKWEAISETIKRTNDKNDQKYADYIAKGDLSSAKKMVFNAAYANGYKYHAWHGTRFTFSGFSKNDLGKSTGTQISRKWFFAADEATEKSYSPYYVMQELHKLYPEQKSYDPEKLKNKGNLYELFIKMDNPLEVDVKNYDYLSHVEDASAMMEFSDEADKNGNFPSEYGFLRKKY